MAEDKKGTAFDVVLKPASEDAGSHLHHGTHGKALTQADIDEEMKRAEEHRNAQIQAMEERLKEHDRHVEEVRQKKQQTEDSA